MKFNIISFNKTKIKGQLTSGLLFIALTLSLIINPFSIDESRASIGEIQTQINVFEYDSEGNCKTNIANGDIWICTTECDYDISSEKALELMNENGRLMNLFFDVYKNNEVRHSDDLQMGARFKGTVDEDVRMYSNIEFDKVSANRAIFKPVLNNLGDRVVLDIKNKDFFNTGEGYCWSKLVRKELRTTYTTEDGITDELYCCYYVVEKISKNKDSTLVIDSFDEDNKGVYICTSIKDGETYKLAAAYNLCESSKLDARPFNKVTYATVGGKVDLGINIYDTMYDYDNNYTSSYESPNNCSYTWYKDGVKTNWIHRKRSFNELKEQDFGTYTVIVKEKDVNSTESFETTVNFELREMTDEILTNKVIDNATKWSTYVNVLGTEGEFNNKLYNNVCNLQSNINDYQIWAYVCNNSNHNCPLEVPNYANNEENSSRIYNPTIADSDIGLYGGNKVIKCFGVPTNIVKNDETYNLYKTKIINGTSEEKLEYAKKLRNYELDHLVKEAIKEETFVFKSLKDTTKTSTVIINGGSNYSVGVSPLKGAKEFKWIQDNEYINCDTPYYTKEYGNIMNCGQMIREEYGCPYVNNFEQNDCSENGCNHNELIQTCIFNIIYEDDLCAYPDKEINIGVGKTAKFYVNAMSSLPIKYEWYDGAGNLISTDKVPVLTNVTKEMIAQPYKCIVSNIFSKKEYTFGMKEFLYNEVSSAFYKVTRKRNSIELRWNTAKNARGYRVYMWDTKTKKYKAVVSDLKTNMYTFTGLQSGKEYKFAVKAYTVNDGNIFWATKYIDIKEKTLPSKTSKISVPKRYKNSVKLSWKPVTGATGYRVYIYKNGKYQAVAKDVKGTSFTKKSLKSKTNYKFAVKAYMKYKGKVIWSDIYTTVNVKTK